MTRIYGKQIYKRTIKTTYTLNIMADSSVIAGEEIFMFCTNEIGKVTENCFACSHHTSYK